MNVLMVNKEMSEYNLQTQRYVTRTIMAIRWLSYGSDSKRLHYINALLCNPTAQHVPILIYLSLTPQNNFDHLFVTWILLRKGGLKFSIHSIRTKNPSISKPIANRCTENLHTSYNRLVLVIVWSSELAPSRVFRHAIVHVVCKESHRTVLGTDESGHVRIYMCNLTTRWCLRSLSVDNVWELCRNYRMIQEWFASSSNLLLQQQFSISVEASAGRCFINAVV